MCNGVLVKKGQIIDTYTYKVEPIKIRELALAIGDDKEEYLNGEKLPPTFPTVMEFWGGGYNHYEKIGFNISRVLHGEQSYNYIGHIKPGDIITITATVDDVYTKADMKFVVIKKEYVNQDGELVLHSKSTWIEKQ